MAIRLRQNEAMQGAKAKYGEAIGALEPLKVKRPPKAVLPPAVAAPAEAPAAAPAVVEAAAQTSKKIPHHQKKIPTPRFEPGTQQKQDWISSLLPAKKDPGMILHKNFC